MRLQFDPNQSSQLDAVAAVTDLFDGQPQGTPEYAVINLPQDSIHLPRDSTGAKDLDALEAIVKSVAERGKAPPDVIRDAILTLCSGRYLTAGEISRLLDRNEVGLRSRFLRPMVREGLIRLRHPGTPNRPDQAYTAAEAPP